MPLIIGIWYGTRNRMVDRDGDRDYRQRQCLYLFMIHIIFNPDYEVQNT